MLCVIFILNIIFFFFFSEREIKINLNNIYFKSDYEIYNQLSLLINFIQEMGNATDDEHGIYRTLYHLRISLDFTTY